MAAAVGACSAPGRLGGRIERGMATAELAVAMPVLVVVAVVAMSGVVAAVDHVRCVDAAQFGARALGRGDAESVALARVRSLAPPGARVGASRGPGTVEVTVEAAPRGPLRWVAIGWAPTATGVAVAEGGEAGGR